MDLTTLVAAILHDVVEDTQTTTQAVEAAFGAEVAQIVDGLTKLSKVQFRSSQEKLAENFRKMILAMSRDIRVIIVKLADRTHNLRTLSALAPDRRSAIAQETLDIYAPLAGRLGIYRLKAELEDLCLRELKPDVYGSLAQKVSHKKSERDQLIETTRRELESSLRQAGVVCEVHGRAKHLFSIYKKMNDQRIDFDDLYDLFALRVIVQTVSQCYESLGIVHSAFRPVPGRFKDYIAMPKANGYQSLHTTVIVAQGELVEIQIRTREMHVVAENGIAAHWAYKEKAHTKRKQPSTSQGAGMSQKERTEMETFNWLKQIVSHQQELSDPDEFLDAVKVDLFDDEVYVFTPKGDVFELRRGATCLDFAFAVHSDLGLRTTGAKVNGRLCPLRRRLSSGDMVEVLSGNKITAHKDWLSYVTTSKARGKIRGFLRTEEREEAKRHGLELLELELAQRGTNFDKAQKAGLFQDVNRQLGVGGLEDFVLQIGYGKLQPHQALERVLGPIPEARPEKDPSEGGAQVFVPTPARKAKTSNRRFRSAEESVRVEGMSDILVRIARCCEPLPGQPIIGFVSRLHGVTVHAADCQWALSMDPARRVPVAWESHGSHEHMARLRLTTHDQKGLLATVTKMVSASGINIIGAEAQTTPDRRGLITLRLQVEGIAQLKNVQQQLEALEGVIRVERLTN
jgi:GTP pyrophosphokinase